MINPALTNFFNQGGETPMVKVAAFHSKKPGIKPVYHDNKGCPEGSRIEAQHLAPGTAMRPRCEHCARLQAQGK
jgi:hypothetical protein